MHQLPLTRTGSLLLAIAALFWLGAQITTIIEGIVPILAATGAILVVIGLTVEASHYKRSLLAAAKYNWKARQRIDQSG